MTDRTRRYAVSFSTILAALAATAPCAAQEAVALDGPTAAADEPISAISGLRELSDGSILVADGLEGRLLRVTPDLGTATPLGREGAGPREYRTPDALYALAGDSTLMVDLGNGRLSTLAPDGSIVRTQPIAAGDGPEMTIMMPGAVDEMGGVFFRKMGRMGPRGLPDSAEVARFDPATGRTVDVAQVKLPEMKQRSSGPSNARQEVIQPIPLSPQDAWTATADGQLVIARQGDGVYWLERVGSNGVTKGPEISYEPLEVHGPDKEAWIASLSGALGVSVEVENGRQRTTFSRGGGPQVDADDFEWPDRKPAFPDGALRVASNGRFWLQRHVTAGEPPRFDVLDARGRRLGAVRLPADRRLEGFGRNSVYLSRTDDLDFVWLERYGIPTI